MCVIIKTDNNIDAMDAAVFWVCVWQSVHVMEKGCEHCTIGLFTGIIVGMPEHNLQNPVGKWRSSTGSDVLQPRGQPLADTENIKIVLVMIEC